MFPIRLYVIAAAAIALTAFAAGQEVPGLGVAFVAGASTVWTAYAVHRQRVPNRRC